jgi:hypothetical protein
VGVGTPANGLDVIDKSVDALRPGGWLVLEDNDFTGWQYLPVERLLSAPEDLARVTQELMRALPRAPNGMLSSGGISHSTCSMLVFVMSMAKRRRRC